MSKLGDARRKFTQMVPLLLTKMIQSGYGPMIGRDGLKHMVGSLHFEGLAVDIDLTLNGVYLSKTSAHEQFGIYWESLGGSWGGRFSDGNHYSLAYQGKK